jgi:hypothetical protein
MSEVASKEVGLIGRRMGKKGKSPDKQGWNRVLPFMTYKNLL